LRTASFFSAVEIVVGEAAVELDSDEEESVFAGALLVAAVEEVESFAVFVAPVSGPSIVGNSTKAD
jgi:hypothetical protein